MPAFSAASITISTASLSALKPIMAGAARQRRIATRRSDRTQRRWAGHHSRAPRSVTGRLQHDDLRHGGYGWLDAKLDALVGPNSIHDSDSNTYGGWVIGGGVETMLWDTGLSGRLEYLYGDFGTETYATVLTARARAASSISPSTISTSYGPHSSIPNIEGILSLSSIISLSVYIT